MTALPRARRTSWAETAASLGVAALVFLAVLCVSLYYDREERYRSELVALVTHQGSCAYGERHGSGRAMSRLLDARDRVLQGWPALGEMRPEVQDAVTALACARGVLEVLSDDVLRRLISRGDYVGSHLHLRLSGLYQEDPALVRVVERGLWDGHSQPRLY